MGRPLAYLLTWTCRGTWLHGDSRGSFERTQDGGRAFITPDAKRHRDSISKTRADPVRLSPGEREAATGAIEEVCRCREWSLFAREVRSSHVHVVVGAHNNPEPMMQQLKAWCTRSLRDDRPTGPVWTRHGSTQYLWEQDALNRAIRYVQEGQTGPFVIAKKRAERQSRAHARGWDHNI